MLVLFDVTALFPSIPINEALCKLKEYLNESYLPKDKKNVYFEAAKTCME